MQYTSGNARKAGSCLGWLKGSCLGSSRHARLTLKFDVVLGYCWYYAACYILYIELCVAFGGSSAPSFADSN